MFSLGIMDVNTNQFWGNMEGEWLVFAIRENVRNRVKSEFCQ